MDFTDRTRTFPILIPNPNTGDSDNLGVTRSCDLTGLQREN
jgi:hypothetical protein